MSGFSFIYADRSLDKVAYIEIVFTLKNSSVKSYFNLTIKILQLFLSVVFFLATPAMGAQYQGKDIDGRKLPATVYYGGTGGV